VNTQELRFHLLRRLNELAEAEGHEKFFSLDEIAAEAEIGDPMKVLKLGEDLEASGLVTLSVTHSGTGATITTRGMQFVEERNSISSKEVQPLIEALPISDRQESRNNRNNTVFVIHGRNNDARGALFTFLRSIGLHPLEWSQAIVLTGKPSPMIPEILDAVFAKAKAVVVLLTGDDEVRLSRELCNSSDTVSERELMPQPRPNVLFEAGLALGRSPNQTIFVEVGPTKPFSDNAGRHVVRITDNPATRKDLVNRLRLAGCEPDDTGTDWLSVGNFVSSVRRAESSPAVPEPAAVPVAGGWLPTSVEVAEPELISARSFTCRLLKQDTPFWRFGWQIEITNLSRKDTKYKIDCRFLDGNGHLLDRDVENTVIRLRPTESKSFSGSARVDATLAPAAARAIAVVSSE
jgi:predicted nucleotide-binding protein